MEYQELILASICSEQGGLPGGSDSCVRYNY